MAGFRRHQWPASVGIRTLAPSTEGGGATPTITFGNYLDEMGKQLVRSTSLNRKEMANYETRLTSRRAAMNAIASAAAIGATISAATGSSADAELLELRRRLARIE